jgi:ATP-dependent helicase STH1/SNF2
LNELLARGDDELGIFTAMDKEREAEKLRLWKEAGNKGPLPPPLMQESELPPFYRRDIGEELAVQAAAEEEAGRGRRAKAEVRYTDGLTDDQWLMAMENSDDDVEEAAERKRKRAERKAERKRVNEMLVQAEAEGKPLSAIKIKQLQEEEGVAAGGNNVGLTVGTPKSGKKRGRPSKSATPSVQGVDLPLVSRIGQKVCRGKEKLMM